MTGLIMINELEWMWKEEVVAHSKVHPLRKNEKNGKKFSVLSFRVKL
jgi:hypothetical protein